MALKIADNVTYIIEFKRDNVTKSLSTHESGGFYYSFDVKACVSGQDNWQEGRWHVPFSIVRQIKDHPFPGRNGRLELTRLDYESISITQAWVSEYQQYGLTMKRFKDGETQPVKVAFNDDLDPNFDAGAQATEMHVNSADISPEILSAPDQPVQAVKPTTDDTDAQWAHMGHMLASAWTMAAQAATNLELKEVPEGWTATLFIEAQKRGLPPLSHLDPTVDEPNFSDSAEQDYTEEEKADTYDPDRAERQLAHDEAQRELPLGPPDPRDQGPVPMSEGERAAYAQPNPNEPPPLDDSDDLPF